LDDATIKKTPILDCDEATRGSTRGREGKIIQVSWAEFLKIKMIKMFSLCFL